MIDIIGSVLFFFICWRGISNHELTHQTHIHSLQYLFEEKEKEKASHQLIRSELDLKSHLVGEMRKEINTLGLFFLLTVQLGCSLSQTFLMSL